MKHKASFTLIELLIVIAILGILAAAVMVAINPGKRTRQARDAQRKSDIGAIANALVAYMTLNIADGKIPLESTCETSLGRAANNCHITFPTGNTWATDCQSRIYHALVAQNGGCGVLEGGLLKNLPIDPINNSIYYYQYEPIQSCNAVAVTCYYWIGARLEDVNPGDVGKVVWRCSDDPNLAAGVGCKEVTFPSAFGFSDSFESMGGFHNQL